MLKQRRGFSVLVTVLACVLCLLVTRGGEPQDQSKFLNPFAGDPEALKDGRRLFQAFGCPGCHGLLGGGGMGKPLLDDIWIFGSDDATLYKLIKGQIPEQTMPRTFAGLPDEQVWKLLAYVRSLYKGDPALINWGLTPPPDAAARIAALSRPVPAFTPPKGLQDMEIPTPSDNPMTTGKIKLGEQLFFDKRLSKAKNMSCETCHLPEKGWTDGLAFSRKFDGSLNTRRTPTLYEVAFYPELYWDGRVQGLEALVPDVMKSQMGADPDAIAQELEGVPAYKAAFEKELGGPPTADRIAKALATFLRTIHAGDTAFDNQPPGAEESEVAQGFKVFSEVGHCTLCHLPPTFTDTLYHNIGVGTDVPKPDLGRRGVVTIPSPSPPQATASLQKLLGAFKTPSLRGVALRGRYFHDGRAKTLDDAADFMMKGGILNPHRDEKLKGWPITPPQREQLLAFLRSLTPRTYPRPELPQASPVPQASPLAQASPQ